MVCFGFRKRPVKCLFSPDGIQNINWASIKSLKEIDTHLKTNEGCSYCHPKCESLASFKDPKGRTPLVLACKDGNLKVVQHIVEQWGADVNKPGLIRLIINCTWIRMDNITEYAYPLFVAAFHGHTRVLRYLIKKGAHVTTHTFTRSQVGLTALHAAVFFSRPYCSDQAWKCDKAEFMIRHLVQNGANPSAGTSSGVPLWKVVDDDICCLNLLIQLGMKLNQQHLEDGRTILHHWAGRGDDPRSLDVVKLLLRMGVSRREVDREGITPLQIAAIGFNGVPNIAVMRLLLDHEDTRPEEKISALELAGSRLISGPQSEKIEGMQLWREAMRLRETHHMPKTPIMITPEIKEFATFADLDEMQSNGYLLQAFLVQQRILKSFSFRAMITYEWPWIYWVLFHRQPQFEICWMMLQSICASEPDDSAFEVINNLVGHLIQLREWLFCEDRNSSLVRNFLITFELLTQAIRHNSRDRISQIVSTYCLQQYCKFILLMAGVTHYSEERVVKCVSELVRLDFRDQDGQTLLHVACQMPPQTESWIVVQHLLSAGADAKNAVDNAGNSPLHTLASCTKLPLMMTFPAVQLTDAGVHVDWTNHHGETAADISRKLGGSDYNGMKKDVLPLTCLSARVASRHLKSRDFSKMPLELRTFIERH